MAILTILEGILGKLAADEIKAWLPVLSRRLLHLAISRLPEEERERYREEWEADLLSYPGEIARCFRALGMYRASTIIRKSARKTVADIMTGYLLGWLLILWLKLGLVWIILMEKKTERILAERAAAKTPLERLP